MLYKNPRAIMVAILLLVLGASGAKGESIDCVDWVIDVGTMEPKPEEAAAADVYIVPKKQMKIRPGTIFKVFRLKSVTEEPATQYPLKLYVGRLQVIDVQNEVFIGRMIEFASSQEYPRVRYETVMVGDCLEMEPSIEQMDVVPERRETEAMDATSMEIPVPPPAPVSRRLIPSIILFKFDSARIEEKWSTELEELARFIAMQRPARVIVEGHADAIGSEPYNLVLSRRRAQAVVDYLVDRHGFDRNIFEIAAYGESRPEASNVSAAGRQRNRRAIVSILREVIPAVEASADVYTEWPAAVELERLVPEDVEIPMIPTEAPTAAPSVAEP
ncbi:MAG: OmpA family protein [Candidatus Hydrogenedentota bacterium]|nr:MAG: OmpA family protein [Candidatus Hydrogenedentota bacterium]